MRRIAAEIAARGAGVDADAVEELFRREVGYATPKVDVRAVAFRERRLLLVRGRDDGLWTPPGGWAEVGETPREAAEKELLEEAGWHGRAVKLIGVQSRQVGLAPFHAYALWFLCELVGDAGEPTTAHEVDGIGFFAEDELPPLSRRAGPAGLAWVFEHLREPHLPPAFD